MSALSFSRSKIVAVERISADTLKAHGILDDYIYGMEIDVEVNISDFKIAVVTGKMNRVTTNQCHRALSVLQNAAGLNITETDFARTVNRIIGRAGCLHLGTLLVECCDSILQAAIFSELEKSGFKYIDADSSKFAKEKMQTVPGLRNSCLSYADGQ